VICHPRRNSNIKWPYKISPQSDDERSGILQIKCPIRFWGYRYCVASSASYCLGAQSQSIEPWSDTRSILPSPLCSIFTRKDIEPIHTFTWKYILSVITSKQKDRIQLRTKPRDRNHRSQRTSISRLQTRLYIRCFRLLERKYIWLYMPKFQASPLQSLPEAPISRFIIAFAAP
jgi:hypothetical protein